MEFLAGKITLSIFVLILIILILIFITSYLNKRKIEMNKRMGY
jgi:CHASE3 domain sensor protein